MSEQDRADAGALRELARAGADLESPHEFQHYLYFGTKPTAEEVARQLQRQGYSTVLRVGADDESWLVLVTDRVVPTLDAVVQVRRELESIAREHGGEYDGWEARVVS